MALSRRGSSRISEENINCRLEREKAKTGEVTASLAWNDPSDLDLHAHVILAKGGEAKISYNNKRAEGGYLDVDMHARDNEIVQEPVENIFWKTPPAGEYSIKVHLYAKRGSRAESIPFRALLKRDGEDTISVEGQVGQGGKHIECFRFTVDEDGSVIMRKVGTPLPIPKRAVGVMKAMKAMRAAKAKAKAKPKAAPKKSTVAKGKKSKAEVFKGTKLKTKGGLKKDDLMRSRSQKKIVSVKASRAGKESKWAKATAKARAVKGYTGFKAIKKGGSFYEKAKEFLAQM